MKKLYLIDANSLIHRAFHALPPLRAPDGRPTQALYGVAAILLRLFREDRPDYAAALFDRPEPTFRKIEYEDYKAHRPLAPDELVSQIIEAHQMFSRFGIRTFEKPGFEADDGIASLAECFRSEPDLQIVILTGDLDTLQLVEGEKVVVRTFRKGVSDTFIYDEGAVIERYGLPPEKLTDYKALVGDPSDNVKGVPGVGPKTAAALIQKFGSLEELYAAINSDPKLASKLAPFKEQAMLSKRLVTLERHVPLEGSLDELRIREDGDLSNYFSSLGFETLVKRLEGKPEKRKEDNSPPMLFVDDEDVAYILGEEDAEKAEGKRKVGFELKAILKELWKKNKNLTPPYFDLGVAYWLIDPDFKTYSPEFIFKKFLKSEWRGTRGDYTKAFVFAKKKLEEYNLSRVFEEIEMPLLRVLAQMETWGIGLSSLKLKALEKKIDVRLATLAAEIYRGAGGPFNLNSPQQLARVLFETLHIANRAKKKTPGGKLSTNAEALEELRGSHPLIPLILEYREHMKIQSTYVRPLQSLIDERGRLHTEFIQTGTATGRLSSQAPNLQNIPQESMWAEELRSAFEAREGCTFLAFDYSQLELRILAALSKDPKMEEAFRNNMDIHRLTASTVLKVPLEKVGPRERRLAKVLNFGLAYGMGVQSFVKASGASRSEAQEFIAAYFKEFAKIREWQERIKSDARTFGYVQTPLGRRRYLFGIASGSPRYVAEAERAAVNHPIQGAESDILKMAMIKIKEVFEKKKVWGTGVTMLLSIHDELLFEVRDDMIEATIGVVRPLMETVYPLSIPLRVEVAEGKDWGHMQRTSHERT